MAASLQQAAGLIAVDTDGPGLTDVSRNVSSWLADEGADSGLLTVFLRHTSASLTVQENADPDVLRDLVDALDALAPQSQAYRHDAEGPDDMPAHIKAALTATSISVPVQAGQPVWGTWQGLYVWEHRARPHRRELALLFQGEISSQA